MSNKLPAPNKINLVYLAGPYWHSQPDRRQLHVESAKLHALLVAELGFVPVTPHLNTARFETMTDLPEAFFLQADEQILLRCDAIILMPGSYKSKGTQAEILIALEAGLPVFHSLEDFRDYVQAN